VRLRLNRSGVLAALAGLAVASALGGCVNVDFSSGWFSRPFQFYSRNGGYTFSELKESRSDRPISANDLVDSSGACPPVAAAPAPAPQPRAAVAAAQSAAGMAGEVAPMSPEADPLFGGGIALGMSECDVVHRAGHPSAVALGQKPNGDRTAVLTFDSGPRPGVYRFERGRLMEMDRVEQPPVPKVVKKRPAKRHRRKNSNNRAQLLRQFAVPRSMSEADVPQNV
jgi:hypothetical protein